MWLAVLDVLPEALLGVEALLPVGGLGLDLGLEGVQGGVVDLAPDALPGDLQLLLLELRHLAPGLPGGSGRTCSPARARRLGLQGGEALPDAPEEDLRAAQGLGQPAPDGRLEEVGVQVHRLAAGVGVGLHTLATQA
jgi:hypothetical protein